MIGLLLLAAALFWTGANLLMDRKAGIVSQQTLEKLAETIPAPVSVPAQPGVSQDNQPAAVIPTPAPHTETEIPDYILNPEMEMPVRSIDGMDYIGILTVPSISLELPVASSWSYDALRSAPCRFSGSAYTDDLVIAGHNYTSHFADLHSLQQGDILSFTDVDGNVFVYRVAETEILGENAVAEMTGSGYALSLFSCTVGGQYRVTVRCERI